MFINQGVILLEETYNLKGGRKKKPDSTFQRNYTPLLINVNLMEFQDFFFFLPFELHKSGCMIFPVLLYFILINKSFKEHFETIKLGIMYK